MICLSSSLNFATSAFRRAISATSAGGRCPLAEKPTVSRFTGGVGWNSCVGSIGGLVGVGTEGGVGAGVGVVDGFRLALPYSIMAFSSSFTITLHNSHRCCCQRHLCFQERLFDSTNFFGLPFVGNWLTYYFQIHQTCCQLDQTIVFTNVGATSF